MKTSLGRVIILVNDYDEALEFYTKNFGCRVLNDTKDGKRRYLHIAFSEDDSVGIWFIKAENKSTQENVGNQTGTAPELVIYTESIDDFYEHLKANGLKISTEISETKDSKYFYCLDLYGNEIVIAQFI